MCMYPTSSPQEPVLSSLSWMFDPNVNLDSLKQSETRLVWALRVGSSNKKLTSSLFKAPSNATSATIERFSGSVCLLPSHLHFLPIEVTRPTL